MRYRPGFGSEPGGHDIMIRAKLAGHYREDARYPAAMVNITNRCNLACTHCFIFRDGNPNEQTVSIRDEMSDETILETLCGLRDRHGIASMLWMGGEPLLRPKLLKKGVGLFPRNVVVTNGTAPLIDFGPDALYVVSLDGPADLNDAMRGKGTYARVMRNLSRRPADFATPVQIQCVVTRRNQHRVGELVEALRDVRVDWMTFSFYVPRARDESADAWPTNEDRAWAVHEVMRLREEHPGFVRNSQRSLELMLPPTCEDVVAACPARDNVLPLWMERDGFVTPFCCYGNDVDCGRCGAWVVFALAAKFGYERDGIAADVRASALVRLNASERASVDRNPL
jgi:MoaA/NifB/PqqE/SkfB family radical SAM enzyme